MKLKKVQCSSRVYLNLSDHLVETILLSFLILMAFIGNSALAETAKLRIAAFGDSLTAGYGLAENQSFPSQLQMKLQEKGYDVEIVNLGVSGDTSTGGLARLDWSLSEPFDIVIVELGANDALRGVDPRVTREAMDSIVKGVQEKGARVLLAGMLAPPNMGSVYGDAFNSIYPDLRDKYDVALYPFFLEGVAGQLELNQADGIHPTAEGIAVIVDNIMPYVENLIKEVKDS